MRILTPDELLVICSNGWFTESERLQGYLKAQAELTAKEIFTELEKEVIPNPQWVKYDLIKQKYLKS